MSEANSPTPQLCFPVENLRKAFRHNQPSADCWPVRTPGRGEQAQSWAPSPSSPEGSPLPSGPLQVPSGSTALSPGPRMCADSEGPGVQTASGGSGDPTVCLDEREDVGGKHEFMECSFFQNPYPGLDGLDVL